MRWTVLFVLMAAVGCGSSPTYATDCKLRCAGSRSNNPQCAAQINAVSTGDIFGCSG